MRSQFARAIRRLGLTIGPVLPMLFAAVASGKRW
jgi:hypothetical protein